MTFKRTPGLIVWSLGWLASGLLACAVPFSGRGAVVVTPAEIAQKGAWVQQNLLTATNLPPFSFVYGGQASSTLLPTWGRTQTDTTLDTNRTQHVITWTNSTLQVRCVVIQYSNCPVVEWIVYLKNIGSSATPVLQSILGLDTTFSRTNGGPEFVLNGIQGDTTAAPGTGADSYAPYSLMLVPSSTNSFSPPAYSGKSSDGATGWPYWNLQMPGGGTMVAVGWPGQWASSFARNSTTNLQIKAGQQFTQLYLNPGEQIRTPLAVLFFWQGTDVLRAQNLWRRWYLAHLIPRVNGQPPASVCQVQGDSVAQVDVMIEQGVYPDILWRDAGAGATTWYPSANGPYSGVDQWINTGTWEVDTNVYPSGFGATSAQIRARGAKFLLWFEPERVGNTTNSFLGTNNPSWLLSGAIPTTVGAILNQGNAGAFNWLTNQFDRLIKTNGVDWYREDMNGSGPLTAWQANDPVNRKGITENFYVQGHLAFWDALLAMNPGLRIDSCASGGKRNDLETMRRAVPLWRCDYNVDRDAPDAQQGQTYGLSFWLPFSGTAIASGNLYSIRSTYAACFNVNYPIGVLQRTYAEFRKVGPILLNGDYYPLTSYSLADNVWMAWQFDRPETGEGFAQIFRRTNNAVASMAIQLMGLETNKAYKILDFDKGELGVFSGTALMTTGLTVQLSAKGSAVLYYTNVPGITLSAGGTPLTGPGPLTVQFTVAGTAATGGALTYAWNFGDGGVGSGPNPTHTYAVGGRYMAQVTASDGLGNSNSAPLTVSVLSPGAKVMKISFPGYSRAETLTNFPALVVLGANLSTNGFAYSQVASPVGRDLVFMNAEQTQPLNYEIESWNTNGSSFVWVQVSQLTNNASIWMYWGDTNLISAPASCTTNGSVWANGFAGVWHLANNSSVLSTADSSPAHADGTNHTATAASGRVDGGANFNGTSAYVDCGAGWNPMTSQQATMSLWAYPGIGSSGTVLLMRGNDYAAQSFGLEWDGNSAATLFTGADTPDWLTDGGGNPTFRWYHVTGVINGNSKLLYVNGQLRASNTFSGNFYKVTAQPLWLGAQNRANYNYCFKGLLDEVRISSLARSSNWISSEFMTVASNAVFSAYGVATPIALPITPVSLSISGSTSAVMISWPTNGTTTAVLQTSTDLSSWTNSGAAIVPSGSSNTVTIVPSNTAGYYRLKY